MKVWCVWGWDQTLAMLCWQITQHQSRGQNAVVDDGVTVCDGPHHADAFSLPPHRQPHLQCTPPIHNHPDEPQPPGRPTSTPGDPQEVPKSSWTAHKPHRCALRHLRTPAVVHNRMGLSKSGQPSATAYTMDTPAGGTYVGTPDVPLPWPSPAVQNTADGLGPPPPSLLNTRTPAVPVSRRHPHTHSPHPLSPPPAALSPAPPPSRRPLADPTALTLAPTPSHRPPPPSRCPHHALASPAALSLPPPPSCHPHHPLAVPTTLLPPPLPSCHPHRPLAIPTTLSLSPPSSRWPCRPLACLFEV
ncbi:hypothetical protein K439DRAFT_1619139 [Ramaria rubella]|nr:hypothetical protein K439DRAFT_1619139 [Ramaria rubella]